MNLKDLSTLEWQHRCKSTSMRPDYVPRTAYTDKTANGLTKAIITFLKLHGWQAERISTTGRYIDESRIVTDILGHQRRIGSGKYIPGTGTKGSSDISATIKGKSVKIEVKIKDKQSEHQKKYQEDVESAGGHYWLVHNFEEFINKYKQICQD